MSVYWPINVKINFKKMQFSGRYKIENMPCQQHETATTVTFRRRKTEG
jgi:hypothetical protein